ncbi:MAG: LacI family DNA-binding transcriptional regulator [Armatimonadota bacterium]|nr:LacI family transcriptional regulator [bacterium]
MGASIQDIANKANVSTATVSRVLNKKDDPHISLATRQRVLQIAKELNYQPNRIARALATGKTHTIGVWASFIHPSHYSRVLMRTKEMLNESGYDALFINTNRRPDLGDYAASSLFYWPVDGVLAFECRGFFEHMIKSGTLLVPAVSMGVSTEGSVDSVDIRICDCALEAVRHLVSLGCKRIVYAVPGQSDNAGDPRHDAYHTVLDEAGLVAEKMLTKIHGGGIERGHAYEMVKEYVQSHGCPDAIFCYNDEIALGCHRGLREIGLRIPEDVALVGCDGIEDTLYVDPPITTICHPIDDMCRTAWEFLQKRIADPGAPVQRATFESELLIRASTARR